MFIVHSVGSDEENPFKIFESEADATEEARSRAKGDVERVFVYEWSGDLREGLAAAKAGRLQEIRHYPHHQEQPIPPPEPPFRGSKKSQDWLKERIKKMPRIARK